MSLLRTIMEHSTMSLSGGSNNSNNANNMQTSNTNVIPTSDVVSTTTATSSPTVATTGTTTGDPAITAINQTSSNTISNNTHNVSAELIAIRNSKEQQRRRERRERRIRRQRRGAGGLLPMPTPEQLQHYYHHNLAYGGGAFDPYSINAIYGANGEYGFNCNGTGTGVNMPDILNSHVPSGTAPPPPPYSTLPGSGQRASASSRIPQAVVHRPPHVTSPSRGPRGWRHVIFPANRSANIRRSQPLFLGGGYEDETGGGGVGRLDKSCCGVTVTQTVSIRWFIVMIAFVGICCSVVGTVLGAMKASGREHLTVSLLMIGVGIVLITVSGIAWRLTSTDAPSCRAMLGLGGDGDDCNGRFLTRPNAMAAAAATVAYGRPQHPYAAMMYSDFNYRPPPPSYQASMQEYRLRLLLLDRGHPNHNTLNGSNAATAETRVVSGSNDRAHQQMLQQSSAVPPAISHPSAHGQNTAIGNLSPPPAYRSHLRTAMANAIVHSRPPSYRSHNSDPEVVIPQLNSTNVTEGDQQSSGNQVLSTIAQINAIDNSSAEHISYQNTSTTNEPISNGPHIVDQLSSTTMDDPKFHSCHSSTDRAVEHFKDASSWCQDPTYQQEATLSQSSTHFHNISSVDCHTGTTISQIHNACEQTNKDSKNANVFVNLPSFSQERDSPSDNIGPMAVKGEKHKVHDKTVPSHLDEAFEVTNSAAELMNSYNLQSSKSDIWQLLPTSCNILTNQPQPKSLPIPQTSNFSPEHLQQYLQHPFTTTNQNSASKNIVNLFNISGGEGAPDNVVNISMDSSSVLSNDSTATSGSSAISSRQENKEKENCHNNHSSLVTIIHHQKSSSDYEESDGEQSSFSYSRLGSERHRQAKRSRVSEHKQIHRPSYDQQQANFTDIVTVTSGSIDTSHHDQQLSSSQKHKDDNYQILSVEGMRAIPLGQQSNIKKNAYASFGNDIKADNNIHKNTLNPTSSQGQQVEFYARL